MGSLLRWFVRITSVVIFVVVVATTIAYWFAARSLPQYNATWRMAGLENGAEIVRAQGAIPHIFGTTDQDVFYGLGVAHAQDRLWQMLVLRRTAQGRLSEIFGDRSLRSDDLMRRLDLEAYAEASYANYSAAARNDLEAYAAGVNGWLDQIAREALGRGAPELFLFEADIAPWRPQDSIAISMLMALTLSDQAQSDVLRARAILALDRPERIRDLLPDAPGVGIAALPQYASLFNADPSDFAEITTMPRIENPLYPVAPRGLAGASNAWAAAPFRATSGATLLANDPHLGLSAPSIWYLARLELASGGVIGATIPGMPIVAVGRSDRLAWGMTSAYIDDMDLFVEELDPNDPTLYRAGAEFIPFETRQEIIQVADSAPVTITLRNSRNGPVIPATHWDLGTVTPENHVMALAWTALNPRNTSLQAGLALMRAQSVDAAIRATRAHIAPSQNLTLADSAGNIALQVIGRQPRRNPEMIGQGRIPAQGWLDQNRWRGMMPAEANPSFVNPEGGIVGNTNNKTIDRAFPDHLSYNWGDTQRVLRWQRLMQMREVHTRDSFIEAQLDPVSAAAVNILPLVGAELWFTSTTAPEGTPERMRARALERLADWDGNMNEHMPEPLIYIAWMRALQQRLIRDDIGPLADQFYAVEPIFIERVFRNIDGAAVWCDLRTTSRVETCPEIAEAALDGALLELRETYGANLDSWRWGAAHEAVHRHPVLGQTDLFSWIVNIRQSTSGGPHSLMRGAISWEGDSPYENRHAAGYRGVYDFADLDSSVFVISTGQSGHPLSRHYDDLSELWRRGEYLPMSLDPTLARAGNLGITTLIPR